MRFNNQFNVWQDDITGLTNHSKQGLKAKIIKFENDIPEHPYLSNRFVIHRIKYKRDVGE